MLEALFLVCIILTLSVLSFILLAGIAWRKRAGDGIIHVVVLGDAGRSPRMQYHCSSLIKMDYSVELIGYGGKPFFFFQLSSLCGAGVVSFGDPPSPNL